MRGEDGSSGHAASKSGAATAKPAAAKVRDHTPEEEALFQRAVEVIGTDPFPAAIDPAIEVFNVTDGHVTLTFLTGMVPEQSIVLRWLARRPVADAEVEAAMLRCFLVFRPVTTGLDRHVEEIIHSRRLQAAVEELPGCKGVSWAEADATHLMHGLVINARNPAAQNNLGVMLWENAEG